MCNIKKKIANDKCRYVKIKQNQITLKYFLNFIFHEIFKLFIVLDLILIYARPVRESNI